MIARQLKQHNPILVFPEGTGTECGPPLPFRRGALVCAYEVSLLLLAIVLTSDLALLLAGQRTGPAVHVVVQRANRPGSGIADPGAAIGDGEEADAVRGETRAPHLAGRL